MAEKPQQRLAYIDWMRGFACLMMFQTHCYDSWLGGAARQSHFFRWSQLGGTLPAPLFLFLAGISFALMTDKLRQKGISANDIARTTIRRGAEIFGLGLLFRVQEFLLGQPWAPWTDLLRVDILNIIGLSLMLMGVVCRLTAAANGVKVAAMTEPRKLLHLRWATIAAAVITAAAIALVTPPIWTTHAPNRLPWFLESYLNGVHVFGKPQPWLFPMFPWAAFAFAGLAVGLALLSDWARRRRDLALALVGVAGAALGVLGWKLDASSWRLYAVYDFWHSSPNFFLIRCGVLMLILFGSYAWCRWGPGQWAFSPLIQLGQTSLLVYWVHIEFVYGRFSIVAKRSVGVGTATLGLFTIFAAMVLLSIARTRMKGRGAEVWAALRWRRPARAAE